MIEGSEESSRLPLANRNSLSGGQREPQTVEVQALETSQSQWCVTCFYMRSGKPENFSFSVMSSIVTESLSISVILKVRLCVESIENFSSKMDKPTQPEIHGSRRRPQGPAILRLLLDGCFARPVRQRLALGV